MLPEFRDEAIQRAVVQIAMSAVVEVVKPGSCGVA